MNTLNTLNQVILIGRLGKDPDMKQINGCTIASFSIATSRSIKIDEKKYEAKTDWHRVVFFAGQADLCKKYLKKGSNVCIQGRLETNQYEKNGEKRYSTQIVGNSVKFLGNKNGYESNTQKTEDVENNKESSTSDCSDIPF